jgi:hypothetical protein
MNIGEIKKEEMQEIIDFYYQIEEYGHIYHYPPDKLDEPFRKILEGISDIRKLMNDSWSM